MTTHSEALRSLKLQSAPVAIGFLTEPPPGLARVDKGVAAGCAYWKLASEGRSFYTLPEDHYNCPVGAFTHNVDLPEAQARELAGLLGTMVQLQYLKADEVPSIPRRSQPLQVAAYAPLDEATFAPDVVVMRGTPRQMMLVSEAARAAGVFDRGDVMGRPACAMIPHASQTDRAVASFGCIGNRVNTGLADGEMYLTLPGSSLGAVLERLGPILQANETLEVFHQERRARLSQG
jgi:uncharacterized protein (DUF169 family)